MPTEQPPVDDAAELTNGMVPGEPTEPGAEHCVVDERLGRIETALADANAALVAVNGTLAETHRAVGDHAERAAARERVIDRQHTEIERLKAVERVGAMRPVIVELGRLRNDLLRQARTLRPDTPVDRFAVLLESYADTVADTLEECGASPLPVLPGAPFEPRRHRVASVTPTEDPERDGTVAEVVADGYVDTARDTVVAPARVVLFRIEADTPAPEPTTDAAPDTPGPGGTVAAGTPEEAGTGAGGETSGTTDSDPGDTTTSKENTDG